MLRQIAGLDQKILGSGIGFSRGEAAKESAEAFPKPDCTFARQNNIGVAQMGGRGAAW